MFTERKIQQQQQYRKGIKYVGSTKKIKHKRPPIKVGQK